MESDKLIFGLIGLVTVAILAFIVVTSSSVKSNSSVVKSDLIGDTLHQKGPNDAKLTIVEFSDFECPFCANYRGVIADLTDKYPNNLRIIYRHFPIPGHAGAIPAARASEAAAMQGKFWQYHDELFANQPNFSKEELLKYAQNIGLDVKKFEQDMSSEQAKARVQNDSSYGRKIGVNATPTFYFVYGDTIEKLDLSSVDIATKVAKILGEPKTSQN